MSKLRLVVVFLLMVGLLWCFTPNTVSACAPLPCYWVGSAEVNGVGVPAGTQISAWINGVKYAETTTGSPAGYEADEFMIMVPSDDPSTLAVEGGVGGDTVLFKIKRAGDSDWLAASIDPEWAGKFFYDNCWSNVLLSASGPEPVGLIGQVHLQGRPMAPDASWVTPLTVVFFAEGTDTVVRTENVTTDNTGNFTVGNVTAGTYGIGIKCSRSLSQLVTGTFSGDAVTAVDFGTLLEGDANNDDIITEADYSLLWSFFGQTSGEALDKCDFNRDGVVSGMDYALLWYNYGQTGDMYGMWP